MEVNSLQDMIKRIVEADSEAQALEEANRKAAEKEIIRERPPRQIPRRFFCIFFQFRCELEYFTKY